MTIVPSTLHGMFEAYRMRALAHAKILETAGKLKLEIDEEAHSIQKLVKEGATTGDRFVDYVMATDGKEYTAGRMHRLRDVDSLLHGLAGEMVLISTHCDVSVGEPPKAAMVWRSKFFCGVLEADELILTTHTEEQPRCRIPFRKYFVEGRTPASRLRTHFEALSECATYDSIYVGPFTPRGIAAATYNLDLPEERISRVIVGNEAVKDWLDKNRLSDPDCFKRCALQLGVGHLLQTSTA